MAGVIWCELEQPLQTISTQTSKLLPSLFEHIEEGQLITVFHAGPALPETVDFFSNYRCKLHFIDVFSELPIVENEDSTPSLERQLEDALSFPSHIRFDICLFWDLFNYLDRRTVTAFMTELRTHLKEESLGHAFSVYNIKTQQDNHLYGIKQPDTLNCRNRRTPLPGYAPHSQNQLKTLLDCFDMERSVLLADSRLEFILRARL